MAEKKKISREKAIPKKKLETLSTIIKLIKENRSIVIVSIKNLPSNQFQAIKKKLKDNAVIMVVKKNIIGKAIDDIEKGTVKNFKKYLAEDQALIFSQLEPFELSAILSKNKTRARAKAGQVVEEDVVIEPGPTELVPGPIISEISNLGIKFSIENGKINVKERKIIARAGEKVTEGAASMMAKFDMKPILVGLEPVVAYDSKEDKIYEEIKIDEGKTVEELGNTFSKTLAFAVTIAYPCKETIKFLLGKASMQEKALSALIKEEKTESVEKKEEAGKEKK
ncbi:MAG: 50S ribosomal protein L10 [Nanoarchaeota archaeon]